MQTTINLDNTVTVRMGNRTDRDFDIHNGAFDHNYLTGADPSAGFMYFCGVATSGNAPTLYRVGFNSIGRVNDTRDALSFLLTNAVPNNDECSPLTEIYNPNTPGGPTDLLFVTLAHNAKRLQRTRAVTVWPVWTLRRRSRLGFRRAFQLGGSGQGTSAIVVDNVADVVPTWEAGTAYALNTLIVDSNGNVQECTPLARRKSKPTRHGVQLSTP